MNYYERKVLPLTIKLKRKAEQKLNKGHIEGALKLTRICAKLLYECNQYYVDNELENIVLKCAHNVDLKYQANESVLFYDGFGIDNRGLAKIYVKGLVEKNRLIYVVDKEREPFVRQVIETVLSNNGKVVFLTAKKQSEKIIELQNIFKAEKPKIAFNYTLPEDVVSAVFLSAVKTTAETTSSGRV